MSELKARTARSIADEEEMLELGADCPIESAQVYLKTEADKVIAEKEAEIAKLKKQMPKYKQFIEDEDYRKKLVDEYGGYVYEWAGHRYIATPYINVFIKGILRTLYKALANWARSERYTEATWHGDEEREELWAEVQNKCLKKAEEYK